MQCSELQCVEVQCGARNIILQARVIVTQAGFDGAGSGVQEGTLVTLPVLQTQTLPVEKLWLQQMDHWGEGCLYSTEVYFTVI